MRSVNSLLIIVFMHYSYKYKSHDMNDYYIWRTIYSVWFIQQICVFSTLRGGWNLRREGHTVSSTRQSITWSPPSSRRRSYPGGKLPDELLANIPGLWRETGRRNPGDGEEGRKDEEGMHRKNQGSVFEKQWFEGRRINLSRSKTTKRCRYRMSIFS